MSMALLVKRVSTLELAARAGSLHLTFGGDWSLIFAGVVFCC